QARIYEFYPVAPGPPGPYSGGRPDPAVAAPERTAMRSFVRTWLSLVLGFAAAASATAAELPKMEFNDVTEIAAGVFFSCSSISATDEKVPFGGSNNIWVVFEDYVAVIDANFPKEAGDVIAAIKKTTDKPIRYVLDTHHHGDHAYGNAVFA